MHGQPNGVTRILLFGASAYTLRKQGRAMFFRLVASAIVLVAFSISPVRAQMTLDVSKITCEQYYLAKVVHPNSVAIWLSGFYNGKRNNTILDVERVKASAYKIRSYCRDNFQTTMVEAVEKVMGPSQ